MKQNVGQWSQREGWTPLCIHMPSLIAKTIRQLYHKSLYFYCDNIYSLLKPPSEEILGKNT